MTEQPLTKKTVDVLGSSMAYHERGEGAPVLFLHGWALGSRAYQRVARRLTSRGCRVYAPVMPGFAGTADLPRPALTMSGYGDWVELREGAGGATVPGRFRHTYQFICDSCACRKDDEWRSCLLPSNERDSVVHRGSVFHGGAAKLHDDHPATSCEAGCL